MDEDTGEQHDGLIFASDVYCVPHSFGFYPGGLDWDDDQVGDADSGVEKSGITGWAIQDGVVRVLFDVLGRSGVAECDWEGKRLPCFFRHLGPFRRAALGAEVDDSDGVSGTIERGGKQYRASRFAGPSFEVGYCDDRHVGCPFCGSLQEWPGVSWSATFSELGGCHQVFEVE